MKCAKLLAVLVAVVAVFGSVSWGAEIGNIHCMVQYQEALKETIRIKNRCEQAAFYDCCQVG